MATDDNGDLNANEITALMEKLIKIGYTCYIKWTCQSCKERVTCSTPNAFFLDGYVHEEKEDGSPCEHRTYPTKFGILVVGVL